MSTVITMVGSRALYKWEGDTEATVVLSYIENLSVTKRGAEDNECYTSVVEGLLAPKSLWDEGICNYLEESLWDPHPEVHIPELAGLISYPNADRGDTHYLLSLDNYGTERVMEILNLYLQARGFTHIVPVVRRGLSTNGYETHTDLLEEFINRVGRSVEGEEEVYINLTGGIPLMNLLLDRLAVRKGYKDPLRVPVSPRVKRSYP